MKEIITTRLPKEILKQIKKDMNLSKFTEECLAEYKKLCCSSCTGTGVKAGMEFKGKTIHTRPKILTTTVGLGLEPETIKWLREQPNFSDTVRIAIAQKLFGKIPIIYGSGTLQAVARRWKGEFNENAKSASYFEIIPEMNHNALVGLQFPKELSKEIFVIILQSKYDHPRNKLRQSITGQILQKNRISSESILLEPSASPLAEILQMIHFGDYVSYYLAILNNVAPEPIEVINFLKDKLLLTSLSSLNTLKKS